MSFEFMYNASALGMGGVIDHADGTRTVISSLASVALPPTGGEGFARVDNYNSGIGISFDRAESRVVGYERPDNQFTTYTDIFVTGLSVFDRLKVALMQVTMTSTGYLDGDDWSFDLHAIYRGVEVDDEEVIPAIDLDLCNAGTYGQFAAQMGGNAQKYAKLLGTNDVALQTKLSARAPIAGAIVTALYPPPKTALSCDGNKLTLPEFGSVKFGEFLVKPGRRRINLLRFEFGDGQNREQASGVMMMKTTSTGDTGSLTVGSGDGNGVPVWPHG